MRAITLLCGVLLLVVSHFSAINEHSKGEDGSIALVVFFAALGILGILASSEE